MFDVGFWEVSMIGVLALIILGPERLPGVARTAGAWMGKARRMMREIKADIKSELDEAELSELKAVRDDLRDAGESFKSKLEDGEQELRKQTDSVDDAITDALNTSIEPDRSAEDEQTLAETAKAAGAAKKPGNKKASKKKATRKKTAKKKAAKKKVSKKKTAKKKTGKKVSKKKTATRVADTSSSTTDNKQTG